MKQGQRVELICMPQDPDPIPPGTRGTIVFVDDAGQVDVRWDNGRSLSLIPGVDEWIVRRD